ncbi:hypothetical protein LZ30DRAFT_781565 [Colletotrichum cereale]|nr:hypothetical protein LZ30DRAFT_781565 [Colletotrichum cereale]
MKPTFFTILVTLAASVVASPVARRSNVKTVVVKRSELLNSGLFKRDSDEADEDLLSDNVNYILKVLLDDDKQPDAYQEEIDSMDPATLDLLFIIFNTVVSGTPPHEETKQRRRDLGDGNSSGITVDGDTGSPRFTTPSSGSRPTRPPRRCISWTRGAGLGLVLSDSSLSIFHSNKKGPRVVAAYALENLVYLRAQVLGKEGRKAFVDFARVDENYKAFCDGVDPPDNNINWKWEKTFEKYQCLDSFDRIINSCDGGDDKNPLNFKFGRRWF